MKIKKRFQVKKLEGTYTKRKAVYVPVLDEDGNKTGQRRLEYVEVEVEKGWMVFFPNGSSIHVEREDELKRMGYDREPDLIDVDSGEAIGNGEGMDLERHVERKTKNTRHSNTSAQKKG